MIPPVSTRQAIEGPAAGSRILSFGFVLLPEFTLVAFAAFLDCLRLAADEGDRSRPIRCRWTVAGPTLEPMRSSCGVDVNTWEELGDPARFDYVVVVEGLLHRRRDYAQEILDFLSRAARAKVPLIGLCTGSFALISAGLMQGRRCCVSWFHYQDLLEAFPDVQPVADQLFIVDGDRITCAGGLGAADLAAWLIERHLGRSAAQKSLNIMVLDKARPANAAQPLPPLCSEVKDNRIQRAMLLISQNLSEPLATEEIAMRLHISRRQLERGFREQLGMSPQVFSCQLRLRYGFWLLVHSTRAITEIALECGFADAAHFSRQFRKEFGLSPSAVRSNPLDAASVHRFAIDPLSPPAWRII